MREKFVPVAVAPDLVTLLRDARGKGRIFVHAVAAEKKGGVNFPFQQTVQQPLGVPAGRAVVKRQRDIFLRFAGMGCWTEKCTQYECCEKMSHRSATFHSLQ